MFFCDDDLISGTGELHNPGFVLWLRWRQEQWACRQQEMWVCNDCVFVLEKKVKQMHTQRSSGCTPRINKEVAACLPALQRESGLCTSVRVTNTVAAWISSSNTENLFMRWQISIVVESGNFRHNVYKMFKYRVVIIIWTISQLQHWKDRKSYLTSIFGLISSVTIWVHFKLD